MSKIWLASYHSDITSQVDKVHTPFRTPIHVLARIGKPQNQLIQKYKQCQRSRNTMFTKPPAPPPKTGQDGASTPRVLTILSYMLEKLVNRNDQLLHSHGNSGSWLGKSLSPFHGVREPGISLEKYIERIYKYTSCSPSCFVVGFVYIDRLLHKYPDSLLLSLNVHRLLLTSVLVASKILDDVWVLFSSNSSNFIHFYYLL